METKSAPIRQTHMFWITLSFLVIYGMLSMLFGKSWFTLEYFVALGINWLYFNGTYWLFMKHFVNRLRSDPKRFVLMVALEFLMQIIALVGTSLIILFSKSDIINYIISYLFFYLSGYSMRLVFLIKRTKRV